MPFTDDELKYLNHGKIYRITCNITKETYFGSTTQELKHRLHVHEAVYRQYLKGKGNYYAVFQIFERGNYNIHLIENYGCFNRRQLESMEGIYIKYYDCINKNVAGGHRDKKIRKYNRKDYLKNKPYKQKYYKKNKRKLSQYQIDRYWDNKRNSYKNKKNINNKVKQDNNIYNYLTITIL